MSSLGCRAGIMLGLLSLAAIAQAADPRGSNARNPGVSRVNHAEARPEPATETVPKALPPRTTSGSGSTKSSSRSSAVAPPLWGTLITLAVVLGGLYVAARWVRNHGPASLRPLPNEALEPLGQRILARGAAVHLVRCGSRLLVLGHGPDGLRTLAEITDPVEVEVLTGSCRRRDVAAGTSPAFASLFTRTTGGPADA